MGFEKPRLSIDEISSQLDRGEITRGDKGDIRLSSPEGIEIIFYPNQQNARFILEGTQVEVSLNSKTIRLSEVASDKTVDNPELQNRARLKTQEWQELGLFE